MTGPDFVIVGAMKCGTSTLAAQLARQPGIFVTTPKEPNYFSDDAIFAKGPGWYADLFAPALPGALRGEASTHCTKLPDYPHAVERLMAAVPDARLIYIIREPVARLISHFVHEWTAGEMKGPLEAEIERHPRLIEYGRYARQIAPWMAAAGADRIHIDTLEAMQAEPQAFLERIGRFLGRDGLTWQEENARLNASSDRLRRSPLDAALIHSKPATWLRRHFVPQSLRDRIKAGRRMPDRPELPAPVLARLHAIYAEDRLRLHALFPGRPDLDVAYPFVEG